jgi:hypothetical protein
MNQFQNYITHSSACGFFLHNWHGFKTTVSLKKSGSKNLVKPGSANYFGTAPPPPLLSTDHTIEGSNKYLYTVQQHSRIYSGIFHITYIINPVVFSKI